MKKLFLTSGVILSMLGQASASTDVNYANNSYSDSACTYPYLDTYESSSSLEAKWDANISGAITLNSNRFANPGDSNAATTANTAAALATVYSKYGTGIYSSTANATNETGAITALTTMPVMTGYNFQGFYTGKAGSGNQVINSSGNYLDAAKTQITSSGAQATWYAHWTAKNNITVSYEAGTAKNTANASSATHTPTGSTASQTATYDSSLTLAANGFTAPAGYTFDKWSSPKVLTTGTSTVTSYAAGASINPWKVADNIKLTATWTPINYTITYSDATTDINGTALYGSLTGSVPVAQTISYDNKVNLTSMTGTRTGYTFARWSGNKDVRTVAGTGSTLYNNGESVTYIYPGDATLTAVWEPNKSGAITLISSVYPSNNTSQTATYTTTTTEAVTPATTSTLYSVYNNGLYKDTSLTPMVASEEKPTKTGYTFGGFYDSGMTTQYITDAGVATDAGKRAITAKNGTATWYAKWTPNQYNVIYNKGTCTYGSGQNEAYTYSNAATYDSNWSALSDSLSANPKIGAPATGWTFDGWTTDSTPRYSSNDLENKVAGYSPWKLTSDLNLHGACTPNISGAITLDSKRYAESGSTEGTAATTNASASTLYSVYDYAMYATQPTKANYQSATKYTALATAPSLTGYTFQGFFTGKAGSGTQVINSDKTFTDSAKTQIASSGGTTTWYAHYTTNIYTITLRNFDDTSAHGTVYEKYDTGWYTNATATTAVTNNKVSVPTRDGYTFRGFYTAKQTDATSSTSSGTQRITKAGTLPANNTFSADTSLYAAWAQNCSAGTGCDCSLDVTDAGAVTYTTSAKTGYTLNSGSSGVYNPQCTAVAKTVTYSCGDKPGSETQSGQVPSADTATYDAPYTLKANTCEYKGWTFDGWSCTRNIATDASGTTSYAAGAQVTTSKLTENVTCTAKWKANTINLNWSANGGTAQDGSTYAAGSSSQSCVYDGELTVPSAPKKNGYTFTGWTVTSTNP